ncbi:MAG: virulence factor SrfC family protein, partial [Myxococcota bacterium]
AERVANCLRDARLMNGRPASPRYRETWETVWHNLHKKYQDRHPYLNELRRQSVLQHHEWREAIRTQEGWVHAMSLFWGGPGYAKDLDRLAAELVAGLEALGHPAAIEVELEHVRASSSGASLIDAACLNSLGSPQPPITTFVAGGDHAVSLAPGVLSALIAELYLSFRPAPGSLLDHADLLDFPGGRALKGINGFGPEELNSGSLDNAIEVFKRGKLTFLFEQFSVDREVTSLVLCSPGPTKPEAIQLQTQVEQWLRIRYGNKTPGQAHELQKPSLFMALTKFDMSLGALRSDNAKDRWDSRVQEACVDFWARSASSWILNWGQRDQPFDNMFWIRNPYADQMRTLEPGQPDYDAVKQGYLASRAVQRHIRDPEHKWAAVEGDNDAGEPKSGVPLLASELREKMAENLKAKELLDETTSIHQELVAVLRALTPSRDEDEQRERILEQAQLLVSAIEREMSRQCSGSVFGELMSLLVADQQALAREVRSVWGSVSPMSIKTSDKVKKVIVHIMKWWMRHGGERVRQSDLGLPTSLVDHFLREICTSKQLLPSLARAIFPHFSQTTVEPAIIADLMRLQVSDAMLELFGDRKRRTPGLPVRLSFSESQGGAAPGDGADAIDWDDVDFDNDEPVEEVATSVEIVFAGNRFWHQWGSRLGDFYLKNKGSRPELEEEDPRAKVLNAVLKEVEAIHVAPG